MEERIEDGLVGAELHDLRGGCALLLVGDFGKIIQVCCTALIGVLGLAFAVQNYLNGKLNVFFRILLFMGSMMLIYPSWATDIVGGSIVGSIYLIRSPKLRAKLFQHQRA